MHRTKIERGPSQQSGCEMGEVVRSESDGGEVTG